jgi:hypothetical protein
MPKMEPWFTTLFILLLLCFHTVAQESGSAQLLTEVEALAGETCLASDETCAAAAKLTPTEHEDVVVDDTVDADIGLCVDNDEDCLEWAETGECDKNPTYMKLHCRKSCKHCSR